MSKNKMILFGIGFLGFITIMLLVYFFVIKNDSESNVVSTYTIADQNETLSDMSYDELIISENAGIGDIILNNVTANTLIIEGGSLNSIYLNNCTFDEVISRKKDNTGVRLVISESTKIVNLIIENTTIIESKDGESSLIDKVKLMNAEKISFILNNIGVGELENDSDIENGLELILFGLSNIISNVDELQYVQEEEIQHMVVFVNGNEINNIYVADGLKIDEPAQPTKDDAKFIGWYYNGTLWDFSTVIYENVELIAKFDDAKKYIVDFETGISTTIDSQTVFENEYVIEPKTLSRAGYTHDGWVLDGKVYDFNQVVTRDITLVAKWSAIPEEDKVDTPAMLKPTSATGNEYVGYEDGYYIYDLAISTSQYSDGPGEYTVDGVKFYTVDGSGKYTYAADGILGGALPVEILTGSTVKYAARVYKEKNGVKTYSSYSNIITINAPDIDTPTMLTPTSATGEEYVGYDNGYYIYDLAISTSQYSDGPGEYTVDGVKFYTVDAGGNYTYAVDGILGGASTVEILTGTTLKYAARVYITLENGNKVYSDYSNIITINAPDIDTPTMLTPTSATGEEYVGYDNGYYIYDLAISTSIFADEIPGEYTVDGVKFYTVDAGGNYTYAVDGILGGASTVEILTGTTLKYAARVYITLENGNKVYSDYSNIITINAPDIDTPTMLTPTSATGEEYVGYDNGYYIYDLAISTSQYSDGPGEYTVDGVKFYTVDAGGNYTFAVDGILGGASTANILEGTTLKYAARVYIILENGNKVYSDYSNIITINAPE